MNRKLLFSSIIYFTLQVQFLFASSSDKEISPVDDSSNVHEFDFSLEYGNTRLYHGIKSSTHPYIKPSFVYASPGGFFTGITGYLPLDSGNIDETDISAGYEFSLSEKSAVSLELIHFFIHNNQLANASLRNEIELYLRHDFGHILKTKIYFDTDFGNATRDYSFTLDNSHDFILDDVFAEDSKMYITPSFSISAGTLNLVRRVKKEIINTGFALTNYDLSLDMEYEIGSFIIQPEAAYDFPVTKKSLILQKIAKSNPVFYFTASITYVID